MADIEEEEGEEKKAKGGKSKLMLIIAGFLFVGASVAGTLYFMGFFASEPADVEVVDTTPKKLVPIYHPIEAPFVVNVRLEGGMGYLQVAINVMAYEQQVLDALELHMPEIRHEVNVLFGSQSYETLISDEGKNKLRDAVLEKMRSVLEKHQASSAIEQIYFTSFVMQ